MLSQTITGRVPCASAMASAMRPTAAKSTSVLVGLAGVSTKIIETRPCFIALSAACAHRRLVDTVDEADRADAEIGERLGKQRLGAAIERLRMQDHVARPREGEQGRGDRRHARREHDAGLGPLVDGQPLLDDLAVGMVEARIDETRAGAARRLLAARHVVEEIASLLGRLEHEGRGQEHRRLDRTFRQLRVEAVGQHHRLGMQLVVADMRLRGFGGDHVISSGLSRQPSAAAARRRAPSTENERPRRCRPGPSQLIADWPPT